MIQKFIYLSAVIIVICLDLTEGESSRSMHWNNNKAHSNNQWMRHWKTDILSIEIYCASMKTIIFLDQSEISIKIEFTLFNKMELIKTKTHTQKKQNLPKSISTIWLEIITTHTPNKVHLLFNSKTSFYLSSIHCCCCCCQFCCCCLCHS